MLMLCVRTLISLCLVLYTTEEEEEGGEVVLLHGLQAWVMLCLALARQEGR